MATSRSWTGKEGDRKEETLYIDVTVWDRQAETSCGVHMTNTENDFLSIVRMWLTSASAPREVAADWDVRMITRGVGWMTAITGGLRADLERWWTGTARDGQCEPQSR